MGIVYSECNDGRGAGSPQPVCADGIYPAVRAGLGLEYVIASNLSFNLDWRWFYTWGHRFEVAGAKFNSSDFLVMQAPVGFRIYFCPPPAQN